MAISLNLKLKNKSISVKLFALTALFFIAFTSVTMILQTLFIQQFYLSRKTKNFEHNFQTFKSGYDKGTINNNNITDYMNNFEVTNNAKIALIDFQTGNIMYTQDENQNYMGLTNSYSDTSKFGTIASAVRQWLANSQYYNSVVKSGNTVTFRSKAGPNGITSIIGVCPIITEGKVDSVFLATSSLQPVGEAASVIREFYVYFYILAIVLIIILSLYYTKMISNPLKKLNRAALKMSHLDFSEKCEVTSEDEIGNLASTFNFLSDNLSRSLNELQQANTKLKADIEKEKRLEKMRKEFVAGVSHELKTPIALISGYAEGLKDNIAEGEERDYYLDVIMDESKKMAHLITDMLDLSQLESGNFKLKKDYFFIDDLLNAVVKKHSNLFTDKGITANLEIKSPDLEVFGDDFRIEQVITNFLSNATKYTPENGTICITALAVNGNALIEIENEGEHIPKEELNNIWEKFYKVEKSRNREVGGTGIGLSIVKNILQLHNSNFGVKNTDKGVKFYFTLKLADSI